PRDCAGFRSDRVALFLLLLSAGVAAGRAAAGRARRHAGCLRQDVGSGSHDLVGASGRQGLALAWLGDRAQPRSIDPPPLPSPPPPPPPPPSPTPPPPP